MAKKPTVLLLQPKQEELGRLFYKTGPDVATWIGGGGSRAGGKSGGLRRIMLDRRFGKPGTSGCIVRRTYKDLNENHIQKFKEEFPELTPYWRATDLEYRIPNGSRLCFRHVENQQAVDQHFWGPEWYDVFVDQAEQFSERELTIIKSSCRWPSAPMNDCKIGLFFNPGGVGTDFLRRIFHQRHFHENERASDYAFIHLFGWDNYVWFEPLNIPVRDFYALPNGITPEDCPAGAEGDRDSGFRCCRFHLFIQQTAEGRKLNSLPPSLRLGHLLGSFESFEGQYFAGVWDESKLILTPSQERLLIQPWWSRWLSHDDGFVHHASIGWFTSGKVSPRLFEEVFQKQISEAVPIVVWYRTLTRSEIEPGELVRMARRLTPEDEAKTIDRYFLSPDAWEKNSKGHSVAEEIASELLRREQVGDSLLHYPYPEQADNARIGGWRYMYAMMKKTCDVLEGRMEPTRADDWDRDGSGGYSLKTPLLFISSSNQDAIEAIPMCIRDTVHAGKHEDVIKTATRSDDISDMCFTWDTLIRMDGYELPIAWIEEGDWVWTRRGLRPVKKAWRTQRNAEIVEATFSDGTVIRCTPEHRFWTNEGWKSLSHIGYEDKISTWKSWNLTAKSSTATSVPAITRQEGQGEEQKQRPCCIAQSGSTIMGRFLLKLTSITRSIRQKALSILTGWNALLCENMSPVIRRNGSSAYAFAVMPSLLPVISVIAPTPASHDGGESKSSMMWRGFVRSVAGLLRPVAINGSSIAAANAVRLVALEMAGCADVFDLEVEGAHEFFANGMLVHNCRYGLKSMLRPRSTPHPIAAAERRQEMAERGLSFTEQAIQMKKMEVVHHQRARGRRGRWGTR